MKGVTYIRLTLKPQAECMRRDCGWGLIGGRGAQDVRRAAQKHVQDTGHHVEVAIKDITEYAPEGTS